MKRLNEIPRGFYCHSDDLSAVCKYWETLPHKPKQENGYCNKYNVEDSGDPFDLLWDQYRCAKCEQENPIDGKQYE